MEAKENQTKALLIHFHDDDGPLESHRHEDAILLGRGDWLVRVGSLLLPRQRMSSGLQLILQVLTFSPSPTRDWGYPTTSSATGLCSSSRHSCPHPQVSPKMSGYQLNHSIEHNEDFSFVHTKEEMLPSQTQNHYPIGSAAVAIPRLLLQSLPSIFFPAIHGTIFNYTVQLHIQLPLKECINDI